MVIPEIEISVKYKNCTTDDLTQIKSSEDSAKVCRNVFNGDKIEWVEEFIMICLNRANKVTGFYKVSSGGINGTVADKRVIFTIALNCLATSIIICHNHPSGSLIPSSADKHLTEMIKKSGEILDIQLLDHIILTPDGKYFSFLDEGLI